MADEIILVADRKTSEKSVEAHLIAKFDWAPDNGPKYHLAVTLVDADWYLRVTELSTGGALCAIDRMSRAPVKIAREELKRLVERLGGPEATRKKIDDGIAAVLRARTLGRTDEMLKGAR